MTAQLGGDSHPGPVSSVGRIKSGVLAAAAEGSVPILPVALDGPHDLMPPRKLRCRPGLLKVNIGQPIATDAHSSDERRRLADEVQAEIVRLLAELRS